MLEVSDKRFFQGLSSTIAGGFIVTFILFCVQYGFYDKKIIYGAVFLTLSSALLMVSNLKFYSFKSLGSNKLILSLILLMLIILIILTIKYRGFIVFCILTIYIVINLLLQPLMNKQVIADC